MKFSPKGDLTNEEARFPNLNAYLKSLKWVETNRSLRRPWSLVRLFFIWAVVFFFSRQLDALSIAALPLVLSFAFIVLLVVAAFYARSSKYKSEMRTAMERGMPRIMRRLLSRGELVSRVGEPVAQRLENLAALSRSAGVAMAELWMMGPKLPPSYKEAIKESGEALEVTFTRSIWGLHDALIYGVPITDESLKAFADGETRLNDLSQEIRAFAASIQKPAPALDTDSVLERLRTLREVERTLAADAGESGTESNSE